MRYKFAGNVDLINTFVFPKAFIEGPARLASKTKTFSKGIDSIHRAQGGFCVSLDTHFPCNWIGNSRLNWTILEKTTVCLFCRRPSCDLKHTSAVKRTLSNLSPDGRSHLTLGCFYTQRFSWSHYCAVYIAFSSCFLYYMIVCVFLAPGYPFIQVFSPPHGVSTYI